MNTLERSASQAFGTLMAQFYNTTRRVWCAQSTFDFEHAAIATIIIVRDCDKDSETVYCNLLCLQAFHKPLLGFEIILSSGHVNSHVTNRSRQPYSPTGVQMRTSVE
jgi:hypothetical protein